VRLGQGAVLAATVYASDDTTKLEDGTLTAVDNQVDTATGMVKLRATFANTDGALFPNEFVNIHLLVNTLTNATLVPAPAVQTGAPGAYVYVVQTDDTVKVQAVTVGPTDGTNTVITQGVAPGDVVVTDGVDRLSDGAAVKVAITPTTAPTGGLAHHHHHHHGNWQGGSSQAPAAQ
jgi:multidrug efflux system membrane fusion protein